MLVVLPARPQLLLKSQRIAKGRATEFIDTDDHTDLLRSATAPPGRGSLRLRSISSHPTPNETPSACRAKVMVGTSAARNCLVSFTNSHREVACSTLLARIHKNHSLRNRNINVCEYPCSRVSSDTLRSREVLPQRRGEIRWCSPPPGNCVLTAPFPARFVKSSEAVTRPYVNGTDLIVATT